MKYFSIVLLSLVIVTPALGENHVVPGAYSATPGTGTFLGPLTSTSRVYQLLIHENQLTALVGKQLTALRVRIPASATANWPAVDATYDSYNIFLSGSVAPVDRSFTFAANIVGVQTQVRSGPLTIPTGAYTFGGSPNAFGPEIQFTPWLYSGGHLLVEFRHLGSNTASRSTDALVSSTAGYGMDFSGLWSASQTSATGAQGNFSVLQFTAEPLPPACPTDIAPPGGNGAVNVDDLLAVINSWGACPRPCPPSCAADVSPPGGNCFVNVDDLLAVINSWGLCP